MMRTYLKATLSSFDCLQEFKQMAHPLAYQGRSSRYTITSLQFFMDSAGFNGRTNARKITTYKTKFNAVIS